MYDLLKEQPEEEPQQNPPAYDGAEPEMEKEETPEQEPNKYDDRFEFELDLDKVDRDSEFHRFEKDNIQFRLAGSTSEKANGNIRVLPDVYIENNSQISPYIMYDIFVHVYNICIKNGLHLYSNEAIGTSTLQLYIPDIEMKYGNKTYENGSFLFSLREMLPQEVIDSLHTKFDMIHLFGHGKTPEYNIFNVPKQEVKSFEDLNSNKKQSIRNTLIIPYDVIPTFANDFNVYRERAIKRGKSILMALSKGTFEGKPYVLDTRNPNIYLWSANKYDSDNAQSSVDKETFKVRPDFSISINGRILTYDGQSADELSSKNWDEYYKLLQFVKEKFKRYNINF